MQVSPFTVSVPPADVADLHERLRRTRWPERETDAGQGVGLDDMQALCAYWRSGYDWDARAARLNAVPQFTAEIDGLRLHFAHVRSPHRGARPLVLTHGWPGAFCEFLDLVGPLTDPVAHGGDERDAFDVVLPSLPGYGFSDRPAAPGWGVERTARAWAGLMSGLGYQRFGAAGSDWGTSVTASLAEQFPDRLVGVHLIPPLAGPDPASEPTGAERGLLAELRRATERGSGYALVQSTRPQTIGYALVDSPAGLCAWIAEKFRDWTDHGPGVLSAVDRDRLLDVVSIYWFTATAASSARMYWESSALVSAVFAGEVPARIGVPVGASVFGHEVPRPSKRWAQRRFSDIRLWREHARGGHFAALEQPDVLVDDLRAFFRLV